MTEQDYKSAIKSLMVTIVVGAVLISGFFILGFVYDIH
jgi:F0F1-type ATP synthase membrane subunit c/vacuolar-type H+-ATPase subunit K